MQAGRGTQPSAEFQSFIEQWLSDDVEDANAGDSETTGFGVEQYPHVSAATPPTCSRRCRICSNQYKALEGRVLDPYARKYNDLDAQESVNEYIRTTEQNLDYVRSSLEAYGNAIHKRWLRRSPDKRAGLLQKAMPEMFTDKRHVARIVLTAGLSANPSALLEAARKAWLLQYLTVEDLSQDYTKLLALMHVRTSYTPSQWISFEFDSQRNAFDYDGIGLCYNPHCVVVGDKDFGRLIQWDREKAHGLEMIGFPLAHLTFEAQKDLSAFLRDMMDMLLGETGQQTPRGCDRWDATVQAGFDTSSSGVLARFANSYGPFSPPCRFDTDRIASLIHGRCAAAGDTLWLLQRDLLSFREFIATAQDTTYHQSLPDSKKLDDLVRHTLQAVSHVDHAVRDLKQARTTLDILRQHESRRALGELPRQEYKDALGLLHGMLAVEFQTQADGLYNIIKHASAFLQHFDTDWKGESNWQTTASQALRVDILYWNTMSLSTPNDLRSHGRAFHFAYIDDFLAKASRKERERVNQTIHDHLSDMAATYEALVIVGSHRPHIAALPEGDINKLMAKYGMDCTEVMLDELLASWDKAEEQLREPLRELLALPLPSVRVNSQSLARTERLHEAMRVFWQTAGVVRADGLQRQGLSRNDAMMRVSHLCVSETKAYKKAKAAELDAIRGAIELKERRAQLRQAEGNKSLQVTGPMQDVWGPSTEQRIPTPQPKIKHKTRQAYAEDLIPALGALQLDADETSSTQDPPTIAVGSDSFCLFQRMFTPSACTKNPASVRWEDFMSALRDAGCSARQNGGSAIMFTHDAAPNDVVGIHRPHPDPTINPIMLHKLGMRLEKHFDWGIDTFVERQKEEQ